MGFLRVMLAIAVVLTHTEGLFGYRFVGGTAAVEMFFMVSGFFMAMILTEKYNDGRLYPFYSNRALRIYVTYFFVLLFSLLTTGLAWFYSGEGPIRYILQANLTPMALFELVITQITIVGQEVFAFARLDGGNFVFSADLPSTDVIFMLPIAPAWSISLELIFYAFAPFLNRWKTRSLLLLVAASVVARVVAASQGYSADPWRYRFFPFEIAFFILGMISYRLKPWITGDARRLALSWQPFVAVLFLYPVIGIVLQRLSVPREVLMVFVYILSVPGIAALFHLTRRWTTDRYVGNLSYPLYLVHWPVMMLYDALFGYAIYPLRSAVVLAVSLVLSLVVYELLEDPLDRYRQRRYARMKEAKVDGAIETA